MALETEIDETCKMLLKAFVFFNNSIHKRIQHLALVHICFVLQKFVDSSMVFGWHCINFNRTLKVVIPLIVLKTKTRIECL